MLASTDSSTAYIERNQFESEHVLVIPSLTCFKMFLCHLKRPAVIALCALLLSSPKARAQQLSPTDFTRRTAKATSGWWSPEEAAVAVVPPHLQVSMSKLDRFEDSNSLRSWPLVDGSHASVNPLPGIAFSAEAELLARASFLSLVKVKYIAWELSLADTRSLTSVNGLVVYPLVQIDYAQWHLPVSLYIPPLRGSDAR